MKPFSDLSDAEFEKWKNAVSAELSRREHAAVALEKSARSSCNTSSRRLISKRLISFQQSVINQNPDSEKV